MQLLPPVRFRLHEEDHEKYGADWHIYDEAAIVRLPVGELAEIERVIDMSVVQMLNRMRRGYVDAVIAQMWLARRLAGVAEPYESFAPAVLLADWEPMPAGDVDPPADSASSSAEEAPSP